MSETTPLSAEVLAAQDILGFNRGFVAKPDVPWEAIEQNLTVLAAVPVESLDLRSESGVATLLLQSTSGADWHKKLDIIQKANGNRYPDFWWELINGFKAGAANFITVSDRSVPTITNITAKHWEYLKANKS